jgi:carbon-monoxide dehydrogenase medium subunit
MKFHHPASGFAVTGVMVSKTGSDVRVAVTGAGPSVFRVPEMEAALAKNFAPDAVANIKVDPSPLMSDIHASADYRAHLVTVMAKRAAAAAN